jgi:hypothetical protein
MLVQLQPHFQRVKELFEGPLYSFHISPELLIAKRTECQVEDRKVPGVYVAIKVPVHDPLLLRDDCPLVDPACHITVSYCMVIDDWVAFHKFRTRPESAQYCRFSSLLSSACDTYYRLCEGAPCCSRSAL